MMNSDMPTLDGDGSQEPKLGLIATHFGGKTPLSERFRRAQLRAQMFGDPGETLEIGRYEITGQVGSGAMGTVYRAKDRSLDRDVAVKVLHRSDDMHRARMTIEAKALAKLSHPNVVTVHEVGTSDGQLFVAMEFVQGKTLQAWLEAPSELRLIDAFLQAAEGLQAAHDAGIVHRDFKPENVMVGDDGRVRVLDFGMARSPGAPLLEEVDSEVQQLRALEPAITRTGLLAGTPGYMAPEQFAGSRVDALADQFAFCIALHEAIWGTRPFAGDDVGDLAASVLEGRATMFAGTPREGLEPHELDAAKAVIQRGLSTTPADRFASMRALTERLRAVPAMRSARPRAPQWLRLGLGGVGALGLALFMATGMPRIATALAGWIKGDDAGPASPDGSLTSEVQRCALGTELRNGSCLPIEWDPRFVQCDGDRCSIDRALLVSVDDQLPLLLRQARVVPARNEQGTPLGFKVFGVRKDTAAGMLGFQNGDIVRTVNDIKLDEDPSVFAPALATTAEKARSLTVVFERDGRVRESEFMVIDPDPLVAGVVCENQRCRVPRSHFEATSNADAPAFRGVRAVPSATDDGQWRGLKLFAILRGSHAHAAGFEAGDLLTHVNDLSLTSMDMVPRLEEMLFADKTTPLTVVYERDGERHELIVDVLDDERDESKPRLPKVAGELPALSDVPALYVGPATLRFESMELARIDGGAIEASQKRGHLVLPLRDHLSEWVTRDTTQSDTKRVAVHADGSTPFGELVDVLYTAGKSGFRVYEFVAIGSSGKRGSIQLAPPLFPDAPEKRTPLRVTIVAEGFQLADGEILPRRDGTYDFAGLGRLATTHRQEHASVRAVVSAARDARHDVLVQTLATLRGETCTTDPRTCIMTHLSIEAGPG